MRKHHTTTAASFVAVLMSAVIAYGTYASFQAQLRIDPPSDGDTSIRPTMTGVPPYLRLQWLLPSADPSRDALMTVTSVASSSASDMLPMGAMSSVPLKQVVPASSSSVSSVVSKSVNASSSADGGTKAGVGEKSIDFTSIIDTSTPVSSSSVSSASSSLSSVPAGPPNCWGSSYCTTPGATRSCVYNGSSFAPSTQRCCYDPAQGANRWATVASCVMLLPDCRADLGLPRASCKTLNARRSCGVRIPTDPALGWVERTEVCCASGNGGAAWQYSQCLSPNVQKHGTCSAKERAASGFCSIASMLAQSQIDTCLNRAADNCIGGIGSLIREDCTEHAWTDFIYPPFFCFTERECRWHCKSGT